MRSTFIAATLAAGALALPRAHIHKRRPIAEPQNEVFVTDVAVDVVTEVAYVTVTLDPGQSSPTAAVTTTTEAAFSSPPSQWHHHWSHSWSSQSSYAPASSAPAPAPSSYAAPSSSEAPVPTSDPAPSTSEAPVPTSYAPPPSSEAPSSTWAPAPSSQAPSSTWAPASSQAPSSSAASGAAPTDYAGVAVAHHNLHRHNHSAPDLVWDSGLAATAGKIAASCNYAHNTEMDGGGYGQNIAAGVKPDNISAIITELFYNGEVGWYDTLYGDAQPDMTNFEHWGHFSQIVWQSTTKVGCATQDCTSQGLQNTGTGVAPFFTVCNYDSPGNFANEYGTNVLKPAGEKTAYWDTGSSVS